MGAGRSKLCLSHSQSIDKIVVVATIGFRDFFAVRPDKVDQSQKLEALGINREGRFFGDSSDECISGLFTSLEGSTDHPEAIGWFTLAVREIDGVFLTVIEYDVCIEDRARRKHLRKSVVTHEFWYELKVRIVRIAFHDHCKKEKNKSRVMLSKKHWASNLFSGESA